MAAPAHCVTDPRRARNNGMAAMSNGTPINIARKYALKWISSQRTTASKIAVPVMTATTRPSAYQTNPESSRGAARARRR